MDDPSRAARPGRLEHYAGHAALGYDFLVLLVLRLLWRWTHAVPALPADMPRWERLSPRNASHIGLYLLMFATTLIGWALAGTIRTPLNKDAFGMHGAADLHEPGSGHARPARRIARSAVLCCWPLWWSCISSAALRHHFIKHNNVLRRMWFGAERTSST